jgi:hypothetical protein
MQKFLDVAEAMLNLLLLTPGSPLEFWVKVLVGGIIGAALLNVMAGTLKLGQPRFGPSMFIFCVGGALMIAVMAGLHLGAGHLFRGQSPWLGPVVWAILGTLILVAPFIRTMWPGGYGSAVFAWLMAWAGTLLILVLIGGMFSAAGTGQSVVKREKARTDGVRELLKSSP